MANQFDDLYLDDYADGELPAELLAQFPVANLLVLLGNNGQSICQECKTSN